MNADPTSSMMSKDHTPPTLSEGPSLDDLRTLVPYYQSMLVSVMTWIADRYERNPAYPFIDTKVDLMTGEEFPENDSVRDRDTIYAYIQGRGLEALAGHARWLRRTQLPEATHLVPRLERILREVLVSIQRIRASNGGHMAFFMTPRGEPFHLDEHGGRRHLRLDADAPYTLSDLFCSKGMYATATYLGDESARKEAVTYCNNTVQALWNGTLVHDQQPLDPKNPVSPVSGRHSQGPYMLSLGTAALLTECEHGADPLRMGLGLIRHVFERHINLAESHSTFAEGDFWEFIDDDGHPYVKDGAVPSDPGHALEFVGLGLKFVAAAHRHKDDEDSTLQTLDTYARRMPLVLRRNFDNGYQAGAKGICKSYDLVQRRPLNTDMPWWNLPEAMRAAAYCWRLAATANEKAEALRVLARCHNAFAHHYVRPELHCTAYQTRDEDGRPVHVIPATADADPGYHTGLSIIDMLDLIEGAE